MKINKNLETSGHQYWNKNIKRRDLMLCSNCWWWVEYIVKDTKSICLRCQNNIWAVYLCKNL